MTLPAGPRGCQLLLTGPMGSGKSTVGRIVADRLGRPFIDSDEQIEGRFGMTGRDLAEGHGVDHLHDAEARACLDALASDSSVVVAAAAGIADRPTIVDRLRRGGVFVVVLDGDAEVLAIRARSGEHRRQLAPEEATRLAAERRRSLARVAELVVDVTDMSPREVADRVIEAATATA